MDSIKLSPRLNAIAEMVIPGAMLTDVGTDHGYLPVRLLLDGRIKYAIATDIRPGPLSKAQKNALENGVDLRCVLCDGLKDVLESETDTIVIAGMGGENIAGILERALWTRNGKTLLLQPMSRPEQLRRFLADKGYCIMEEKLVKDNGKIYSILCAQGGGEKRYSDAEYYTGHYEMICDDPLFTEFILDTEVRFSSVIEGLSRTKKEELSNRRQAMQRILTQLKEMRERHDKSH